MDRHFSRWHSRTACTALSALVALVALGVLLSGPVSGGPRVHADHAATLHTFQRLPLSFEPAAAPSGDSAASFVARGPGYRIAVSPTAAVLAIPGIQPASSELVRLDLVGANAAAPAEGLDRLPGTSNYFIGHDPKAWRTNVPTFSRVRYASVYPGIDLVYYGNPQRLEYDVIVKPGADVKAIRFAISNGTIAEHRALRITADGDLAIPTAHGELLLRRPVVYQEAATDTLRHAGVGGSRKAIESRYVLASAHEVGFEVGDYDRRQALVIDPTLQYSSFLGGSGWDFGVSAGVAVDAAGNLFIASGTESADFPGTSGGYQGAAAGCNLGGGWICGDAFVTKINAAGTAVLYTTYVGGTGADGAYGMAVDGAGNAYLTGPTDSPDFPTTPGAYQVTFGGDTPGCAAAGIWPPCGDTFVTKLNPAGAIVYSTYLGGSNNDYAEAVAVDSAGNAYVTGMSYSADFPTTSGAFQETSPGTGCGSPLCGTMTVSKLNASGTGLVYSTWVGGTWGSSASAIAVNAAGEAYMGGSGNYFGSGVEFPTTANAFQRNGNGGSDIVLVKLNAAGSDLAYSSYIGGSSWEFAVGATVDAAGNGYVVGGTNSPDFHTTAGAFQTTLPAPIGNGFHGFVVKFDPSRSGAASLVFSTLLGGSGGDAVVDVKVSPAGNVYVAGGTSSPDFPTAAPLQGQLASGKTCGGNPCADGIVAELNAAGSQLLFSTFLGGTGDEQFESLALDAAGNIYVGGGTGTADFPTTPGALQPTLAGPHDMFVAKISPSPNTAAGGSVAVQPVTGVTITFGSVTAAGTTAVTRSAAGPSAPAGFTLGSPAVYYDVSTTATFSGPATVCFSYAGVSFGAGMPALFHYQNNAWVNVTTSIDASNQVICGGVTSFSPFAVFGAVYAATVVDPIAADGTSTFKAQRGSVPVKFGLSLGGAPTCSLPPATIVVSRVGQSSPTVVNEDTYSQPFDTGSKFRIDSKACQYVYNLDARSLGAGAYRVDITIYGTVVGSARFSLK
jgi:hypothetical protein